MKETTLPCSADCKFPGKPCGFNSVICCPPCATEISKLKSTILGELNRVNLHTPVGWKDIITLGPSSITSMPKEDYRTIVQLNARKPVILGTIIGGIFRSD